jgi:signal peptide peptidase SppA
MFESDDNDSKREKEPSKEEIFFKNRGVGMMSIEGTLVNKCSSMESMCGMISTSQMHEQFLSLSDDPNIKSIYMYVDSPGGEVTGIFEFAQSINKSSKMVYAFTDNMCCSGGYALACAADVLVSTPSAQIGSIGVYQALVKETMQDVSVTIVQAGKYKTYGNNVTPITQDEIDYFQASVNATYDMFVEVVSKCRGLEVKQVMETEGRHGMANSGLSFLVDDIMLNKTEFIKKYFS